MQKRVPYDPGKDDNFPRTPCTTCGQPLVAGELVIRHYPSRTYRHGSCPPKRAADSAAVLTDAEVRAPNLPEALHFDRGRVVRKGEGL